MKINFPFKKILILSSLLVFFIIPSVNAFSYTNTLSYVSVGSINRYSYISMPNDFGTILNITASDNAIITSHTISGPYIQLYVIGGLTADGINYTSNITIYYEPKLYKHSIVYSY